MNFETAQVAIALQDEPFALKYHNWRCLRVILRARRGGKIWTDPRVDRAEIERVLTEIKIKDLARLVDKYL